MEKVCNFITISLILALASAIFVAARDPDILNDFLAPLGLDPSNITQQHFTYTGFRKLQKRNFKDPKTALETIATMKEFPALEGQGVSISVIVYPPSAMNLPHIHPRSSELLMVLQGSLEVGFVDTKNKLFKQTLQTPDLFVFPQGLVHFQVNTQSDLPTVAVGVFGSASPGTVSIPSTIFGSEISAEILAKAFKTDEDTISKLIQANN